MTISIKPTASGSTIEQDGSTILTVDGSGNITPSNQLYPKVPAFSAYTITSQSFTTNTWTKVALDLEQFDTNSNYDNSLYRFTPSVAGYYQISASVKVESVGSRGILGLYKNGSIYRSLIDIQATYIRLLTGSALIYLNGSTDYIELYMYSSNGTPQTFSSVPEHNHFDAVLVSV